jgi:hypothetical protein
MRARWRIAAASLLLAAGACKGKAAPAAGDDAGTAAAAAAEEAGAAIAPPPPEPASALTPTLILKARDLAVAGTPWAEAYARLTTVLGEPSMVEAGTYWWAALDGTGCIGLSVEQRGDLVGTVMPPQRVEPIAGKYFETCRRAAAGEADLSGDVPRPSAPPDIEIPAVVQEK